MVTLESCPTFKLVPQPSLLSELGVMFISWKEPTRVCRVVKRAGRGCNGDLARGTPEAGIAETDTAIAVVLVKCASPAVAGRGIARCRPGAWDGGRSHDNDHGCQAPHLRAVYTAV